MARRLTDCRRQAQDIPAGSPQKMFPPRELEAKNCVSFSVDLGLGQLMNALYEDYRREAEYCERRARQAPNAELQADWLRLAAQWLMMIPNNSSETAAQRFDAAIRDQGTGQEDSASSH